MYRKPISAYNITERNVKDLLSMLTTINVLKTVEPFFIFV